LAEFLRWDSIGCCSSIRGAFDSLASHVKAAPTGLAGESAGACSGDVGMTVATAAAEAGQQAHMGSGGHATI
jgi:hypothetical protein